MAVKIEDFEKTTVNEWGEAFGLICLVPDTVAYRYKSGEYLFTIGFSEDEEEWVCQIDDSEGGCVACYQGETPQAALENASVEACATEALRRNDNCEDAVNCMAYDAYELLNGGLLPAFDSDFVQADRLLGLASEIVKARGEQYGIKWESYQVIEA